MRKYDKDDNKADIVKLAIRRAIEDQNKIINTVEDARAYISKYGPRQFIGGCIDWSVTAEGGDFWLPVYTDMPERRK